MNPILATVLTFVLALAFLRLMDFFAHRGWIESRLSRKLIHIGTGPIFVLCWLFFPNAPESRWLAALVPFAITVQFALVGLGIMKDEASVKAMSRTGDRHEILRGPLFYGIMFVALTVIFWKDSPVGMTALMVMCGGDGIADLVGRRFKSRIIAYSPEKSLAGSLGVLIGGWLLSAFILAIYTGTGVFKEPFTSYIIPLAIIALVSALVEILSLQGCGQHYRHAGGRSNRPTGVLMIDHLVTSPGIFFCVRDPLTSQIVSWRRDVDEAVMRYQLRRRLEILVIGLQDRGFTSISEMPERGQFMPYYGMVGGGFTFTFHPVGEQTEIAAEAVFSGSPVFHPEPSSRSGRSL